MDASKPEIMLIRPIRKEVVVPHPQEVEPHKPPEGWNPPEKDFSRLLG